MTGATEHLYNEAVENAKLEQQRRERDFKRMSANQQTLQAPIFLKACELAGIKPTKRQASKWNNQYGAAWRHRTAARHELIVAEYQVGGNNV